jgi:putative phosphoesterase
MRPEAAAALRGSELIMHAGDVGKAAVINELGRIAATFAVRGNVDIEAWAASLPTTETVAVAQLRFYMLHQLSRLDLDPAEAGFAAVVHGHTHRPSIETRSGVLYLNPGSAGPRRFKLPVTVARVCVSGRKIRPEIVDLAV